MPIVFFIPGFLRQWTDGKSRVELQGQPATVADALALLWEHHPGVRDRVMTEQGNVRPHVNVFVGPESIRFTGGLATPLQGDREVSIVPAVSGG